MCENIQIPFNRKRNITMRYMIALAAMLSLHMLTAPAARADHDKPLRSIAVSGEAEVRVVPDQALISMTAENRGRSLVEAKAANDKAVSTFIAYATEKLGVDKKHIQTDFVSIEPVYRQCNYDDEMQGRCDPLQISYYNVRKGIQVRLTDLSKYETLVTGALSQGVSHINDIQFQTSELRKHRDTARSMAAKAAQEKAAAIAGTLGMKIAKPINVSENVYSIFHGVNAYGMRGGAGRLMMQNAVQAVPGGGEGAESFALGQINITANVQASFELE